MGTNQDLTKLTSLFEDKSILSDADKKIGQIYFTRDQKVALAKLIGTPVWDVLKIVYVKQRLVQLAVAGINAAQTEADLQYFKGKAAEADQFIKQIELTVREFNEEEEQKKTAPKS